MEPQNKQTQNKQTLKFPAQIEAATVAILEKTSGLQVNMNVDGHLLTGDEPIEHGGQNKGADPYGYLAAALASCTAMTLKIYADFKKLDFTSVKVIVRHEKIHAKDCETCESKSGRIDRFVKELFIEGEMSPEQKQRMLAIADRCPVHRTLKSEINIVTRWQ